MQHSITSDIAVLILFFNKPEETIKCIDSFVPSGVRIYILDNGSEAKASEMIQKRYSANNKIIFIKAGENLGPAKGRNRLINSCPEEWLFLVDNDITITPKENWHTLFSNFAKDNPDASVICPVLFNVHENASGAHPEFILHGKEISLEYSGKAVTNYFPSGASIVKRSIFEKNGMFDEQLFAFEDYEYAIRVLCAGGEPLVVFNMKGVTLLHEHKFQSDKRDKDAVRERYNTERLDQSFRHMQVKNGITFDHDWKWWSAKQLEEMTGKSILKKIKDKAKQFLQH